MGLTATIKGNRITSGKVSLPKWGRWFADVSVDGEVSLSGLVTIVVADLTLVGTVLSGGANKGRSTFRVIAGHGGWGKSLKEKSYATDLGVKVATVVADAAREAGETVSLSTTAKVGPAFVRKAGPASKVLEHVAPSAWYVGEDGITRLGARPVVPFTLAATRVSQVDLARRTVTLASDSIKTLVPGAVVDGLEAVDVQHEITPKGLRSTIWGSLNGEGSRRLAKWRALMDHLDPDRYYRAVWEYRVVVQTGERLDLQPERVSTGMPNLKSVRIRYGVAGVKQDLALGSKVLVAFVDGNPTRPVVVGFEDAEGSGFTPLATEINASTTVKLGLGLLPVARGTDLAGGIWPIAPTQVKTLA